MPKSYSSAELIALVTATGWRLARTRGSHHIFKHDDRQGTVVIPHPVKDIPRGTAKAILKAAGCQEG